MHACTECHAGCCRAFAIPVTPADIIRICREYRLTFDEVAARWPDPDGGISRGVVPQFYFDDASETPYVIGLLHAPSAAFPGTTRCRFLQELPASPGRKAGVSRCAIYAHRPGTCRIFPASTDDLVQLKVADIPAYGRPGENPAYRLCPESFTLDDRESAEILRAIRQTADEMQFFHLMADLWNRTPRPWSLFGEFLLLAQSERVHTSQNRRAA